MLLLLGMLCAAHIRAQDLQPVPPLAAHVTDQTGTLDSTQRQALEEKLSGFERDKGVQVAVLMVATTRPEDIASYANRVGNAWKIGRKGVGDGVLLVVAKQDRAVRIEVAKTLEGAVPDLAAKDIIDGAIVPAFQRGDFAGGLEGAVDQLIARISGEPLPAPERQAQAHRSTGFDWENLAIFLFVGVPIAGGILRAMFGRPLGSLLTGAGAGAVAWFLTASIALAVVAAVLALLFALVSGLGSIARRGGWGGPVIMTGGGWGRGGGGLGGGGWRSGGGGDFGGGGASGNW